jgi:hypothetical protein
MTLGIMQPYFFPYVGYFSLIKATCRWIVFDTPQYKRESWMNRNRIIKPDKREWMYFHVPVNKSPLPTAINQKTICNNTQWHKRIIGQLGHYRKHAPYYKVIEELLLDILNKSYLRLLDLNVAAINAVCEYLGIDFKYEILSEMNLELEPVNRPEEWALVICKALGFNKYLNAEGGMTFFQNDLFQESGIEVQFLKYGYPEYDQKIGEFIPRLSILDTMMFNSSADLQKILDDYQLVELQTW